MSKYDKERTEAAKRFSNMVHGRGLYPSVESPVMRTHHVYDREAQNLPRTDANDWEDKRADEFPDAVFYTCMVAALLYFGYTLFSNIADWLVGL